MSKYAILADSCSEICDKLLSLGYKLIYTIPLDRLIPYEQKHADMQCIAIDDTVFVLKECLNLQKTLCELGFRVIPTYSDISSDYPHNIALNCKIIGNSLVGNLKHLDKNLISFCVDSGYELIDVKQGYSACSITKVTNNAIITADESIYRSLLGTNIEVLKITNENIGLHGAMRGEKGFIGGASVLLDEHNLLFFGNIKKHPDYNRIIDFCNSQGVNVLQINNIDLIDIGGIILLNI